MIEEKQGVKIEEIKNEKSNLCKKFKINFSFDIVKDDVNQALIEKQKNVKYDGFRQSSNVSVPYSLIEKKYKSKIEQDIVKKKTEEIVSSIVKKYNNSIIGKVDFSNVDNDLKKRQMSLEIFFEIIPEISIPDFSKISLDHYSIIVSENEVLDRLKMIAKSSASFDEKYDGKNIKDGDRLSVDLKITDQKGKEVFLDVKDITFDINSDLISKDFEKNFISKNKLDEFNFDFNFPEQYIMIPKVSGKMTKVFTKIVDVKRYYNVPDIDENFVKKYGCNSLDELNNKVSNFIREELRKSLFNIDKKKLFDSLNEMVNFDVPPLLLKKEEERIAKLYSSDDNKGKVIKMDSHKEFISKKASRNIRLSIIFLKCVKEYNIKVEKDEFKSYVNSQLANCKTESEKKKVAKTCEDNYDSWTTYQLEQKTISYIMQRKVTLNEKKATIQEIKQFIAKNK